MKATVRTELPSTDMGRDTGGTEGTRGVLDVFGLRCLFNFHIDLLSISWIQESGVLVSV